jgi:hypothetical protein
VNLCLSLTCEPFVCTYVRTCVYQCSSSLHSSPPTGPPFSHTPGGRRHPSESRTPLQPPLMHAPAGLAPAASGSWTASPPPRTQAPARCPLPRPPSSQATPPPVTPPPPPPHVRCPAGNSVRQLRSYSIPFCLDGLTNYCFDLSPFRSAAFVSHVPFFCEV